MEFVYIGLISALIIGYGLASRRLASSVITAPMVFVTAGVLMSEDVSGITEFSIDRGLIEALIEVTLILVLFTDAVRIDLRRLRREAELPGRLLSVGMVLTIGLGTAAALLLLPDLEFWQAALVAAMLAPTDAALGQAVLSQRLIPVRVRQTLNVESGLNDGIALPIVTILIAFASIEVETNEAGFWLRFIAEQIGFGIVVGILVGGAGAWLITRAIRAGTIDGTYQQLAVLAVAVAAWAFSSALDGNGFIAAFVGGATFGLVARGASEHVADFTEDEGQLLTILTFLVFGMAFVAPSLNQITWQIVVYAALSLTVIRMVPVAISLLGAHLKMPTIALLGWFGPRGLASILFLVLALEDSPEVASPTLVVTVTMTVLLSIFAHGMTANPLGRAYGRWATSMADTHPDMIEHEPAHEHPLRVAEPGRSWFSRHNRPS